jgi:hypothetical protein
MPSYDVSMSEALVLQETLTFEVIGVVPYYGSLAGASRYFSEQIYGQLWEVTPPDNQEKALITATRAIDNLRFAGRKTDLVQPLEYPRNGDTEVPQNIQRACYEEALARLNGIDPDTEYGNLNVTSRVFGLRVRTDYDVRTAPAHIVAGIGSKRAWDLLIPYLDPARGVTLRRRS